jgi:hypothetical protein
MIISSRDESLKRVMKQTGRHIFLAGAQNMNEKKSVHGETKLLKQERWYKFTNGAVLWNATPRSIDSPLHATVVYLYCQIEANDIKPPVGRCVGLLYVIDIASSKSMHIAKCLDRTRDALMKQ